MLDFEFSNLGFVFALGLGLAKPRLRPIFCHRLRLNFGLMKFAVDALYLERNHIFSDF